MNTAAPLINSNMEDDMEDYINFSTSKISPLKENKQSAHVGQAITEMASGPSTHRTVESWPELLVEKPVESIIGGSGWKRKKWKECDPALIERTNLVYISKLIAKELIESSVKFGRMVDSDYIPLQHFFIVLEHILRHGLKPKKGLLGPKKEVWDVLQLVEHNCPEASDITTSVRNLPTVKSPMGRSRAWLRLALMQKKLSDYFKILIDRREELIEFYENWSLMLNEDAVVIMGLLVGLNVIDCNLCVKEEDLESQQGVIDFSLYFHGSPDTPLEEEKPNMTTVLDQKNYIEELNRHLNATITNLQAKIESLITTNALVKEDLAISKNNNIQLKEENQLLKTKLECLNLEQESQKQCAADAENNSSKFEDTVPKGSFFKLEKELEIQISIKSQMEMAMKLLEKDVHEKQDTIISLRKQLDDIKSINLEMYKKLQECETSLKHKTDLACKLESKCNALSDMVQHLEAKLLKMETERHGSNETARALGEKVAAKDVETTSLKSDLQIEREWRKALEDSLDDSKRQIMELSTELSKYNSLNKDYERMIDEHRKLQQRCYEYERSLEEMGVSLSESKLKVEDLNEITKAYKEAQWKPDKETKHCQLCQKDFNLSRRKHHCRNCGGIFCNDCSSSTMPLPSSAKPLRVCDKCLNVLLQRYN